MSMITPMPSSANSLTGKPNHSRTIHHTSDRPDENDADEYLAEMSLPTSVSLGLISCHHCGTVWEKARTPEPQRCGRCQGLLHVRKPDSINRTWALLIAACMMYIPANLMPVMITKTLFTEQHDTILSGIIYFWISGDWELACIVFIASFLVPLFKLSAMILLTITTQRKSHWRCLQRAQLYRIVEAIGRWSMLDVFVVSLLAGLVQISGFARITAGVGVAAFGSVVILTMLASLTFDSRLIWDTGTEELQLGEKQLNALQEHSPDTKASQKHQ